MLLYIRKNLKVNPTKLRNSLPEFLLIQKEVKQKIEENRYHCNLF